MPRCLVALGSNLGDRRQSIERAVEWLALQPYIDSVRCSSRHETAPIGGPPDQPPFLNAAVSFETTLSAEAVHAVLQTIEDALGRRRVARWEARPIDLDLLLYGDETIDTPSLTVPHPRMAWRRFVLQPAAEVAAEMTHPVIGWTIGQLLDHLNAAPSYVALSGPAGSGKTALAERLARAFHGRLVSDPGPESASGPAYQRQIQFLDRRRQSLERAKWPQDELLAVSDFYFDQGLVYARVALEGQDLGSYTEAWRAARAQVVLPKLLVVLDTPRAGGLAPRSLDFPASDRVRDELLRLAVRGGAGPVLVADGADPASQYDEIAAAIQSMQ